jgi:hypothetical protein
MSITRSLSPNPLWESITRGISVYRGKPLGGKRTLMNENMAPMIRAAVPYVLVGVVSVYLFYLILH